MRRARRTRFADGALFAFVHASKIGAKEAILLRLARKLGPVAIKPAALAEMVANVEISAPMNEKYSRLSLQKNIAAATGHEMQNP